MKSDSASPSLQCTRCRSAMEPLYIILDPTTGNHFRAFKCDCGERTLRYENWVERPHRRVGISEAPPVGL
jgi:hypothetical protein